MHYNRFVGIMNFSGFFLRFVSKIQQLQEALNQSDKFEILNLPQLWKTSLHHGELTRSHIFYLDMSWITYYNITIK